MGGKRFRLTEGRFLHPKGIKGLVDLGAEREETSKDGGIPRSSYQEVSENRVERQKRGGRLLNRNRRELGIEGKREGTSPSVKNSQQSRIKEEGRP